MFDYLKSLLFGYKIFRRSSFYQDRSAKGQSSWDFGQFLANFIDDIGDFKTEIRQYRQEENGYVSGYELHLRGEQICIVTVILIREHDLYNVKVIHNPRLTKESSQKLDYLILGALDEFNSCSLKTNSHEWAKINSAFE